ncbi:ISAs1 family transposase [Saccharothrix longispora]|uniref:ISAs1 family transposase n=1 Tax=Saccharothrix longispora TaxID=33920 RepID=UPI00398D3F1C
MTSSPITALTVTPAHVGSPPPPVTDGEHGDLLDALAKVPDPRDPRGIRYPLSALLTVAVCAVLAGASSFAAISDWLRDLDGHARDRLGFDRIPSGTTMWRLLTRLDADLLATVLAGWLTTRARRSAPVRPRRHRHVIAVDGKTLRGAHVDGHQVHLLSALDTDTGIVLTQVTVDAKSNEIPAFTPLLDAGPHGRGHPGERGVRRRRPAHPDRPRPPGRRPRSPPDDRGQRQPAHVARPTQSPAPAEIPVGDRTRDRGHGRRETRTVKAVTTRTPGGIAFRTLSRPSGSPAAAPPARRPPVKRSTSPCPCPPATPRRPSCRTGSAASGSSRTRSTTSAT